MNDRGCLDTEHGKYDARNFAGMFQHELRVVGLAFQAKAIGGNRVEYLGVQH